MAQAIPYLAFNGNCAEAMRFYERVLSLGAKLEMMINGADSPMAAQIPAEQEKVAFGATVLIRHGNGEEEAYRIVGVEEADPDHGSISWISPLARALLSRRAGDRVRFRSPAGEEELTILSGRYSGQ